MAQRIRFDAPGAWLHIMNRGIARRTLFESRADHRYFLACTARAVRAGWIEIHAYSLLGTHFHFGARSPVGESWRGLRMLENAYSRRFNVKRRRDGPLFRGRFRSKRIRSEAYWLTVMRYIDENPVVAGLVEHPADWPFGSAAAYQSRASGPSWLSRDVIESHVTGHGGRPFTAELYRERLGRSLTEGQRQLVGLRLEASTEADDALDDLVGAAPERVAAWMHRKAMLADGTRPGVPVVLPRTLEAALAAHGLSVSDGDEDAEDRVERAAICAGLFRLGCGASYDEIAARLGCSRSCAHGRVRAFRQLVDRSHPLVERARAALHDALTTEWPDASAAPAPGLSVPSGVPSADDTW